MAPERCNNSVSKYASFLLSKRSALRNNRSRENSLATVFNCYPTQDISRRSTAELPEHCKRSQGISSLPSGEGHERPFRGRKCKADECDKGLQENGDAFRAYAHIHP